MRTFFEYGAKEVHCRISCPPLVYGCPFIGFTASKSDLELITRRIIRDFGAMTRPTSTHMHRQARLNTNVWWPRLVADWDSPP